MRVFLILCAFIASINARPKGYNYGVGDAVGGAHGAPGSLSGSLSGLGGLNAPSGIGFGSLGTTSSNRPGFGTFHSGNSVGGFGHSSNVGSLGFGSGIGGSSGFGSIGGGGFNAGAAHTIVGGGFGAPIVHKQFITISAPEDHETLEKTKHFIIGRPQKNYRVVFIKAPSSSAANVKLSAEYAPQEENTVIYVLSKKDSTLEVNDIATPAPTVPSKPEVVFIKYKTEEEAQHAQQQIQAEYDKIEGTSEHTNGGIGQQQSVVGILGSSGVGAGGHVDGASGGVQSVIGGDSSYSSGSSSSGGIIGSGVVGSSGTNSAKSPLYLPPSTTL